MTSSTSAAADRLKAESFGVRIAPGDWEDHDVVLLSVALKIVEAQQTDDTLSELRAQIAERILMFKNASPPKVGGGQMMQLQRMECDTAVRQLEWVLKVIDSAEARKKEEKC